MGDTRCRELAISTDGNTHTVPLDPTFSAGYRKVFVTQSQEALETTQGRNEFSSLTILTCFPAV